MLWAIMKAAADMADATHDSIARRKAADRMAITRDRKLLHQEEFAEALKAEAGRLRMVPAKSVKFVRAVAPGLKDRLALKSEPGKDKILRLWT